MMRERRWQPFSTVCENRTGDLALWWEVAREWRLGRQEDMCAVAARKTYTKQARKTSGRGRHRQSQGIGFLVPA